MSDRGSDIGSVTSSSPLRIHSDTPADRTQDGREIAGKTAERGIKGAPAHPKKSKNLSSFFSKMRKDAVSTFSGLTKRMNRSDNMRAETHIGAGKEKPTKIMDGQPAKMTTSAMTGTTSRQSDVPPPPPLKISSGPPQDVMGGVKDTAGTVPSVRQRIDSFGSTDTVEIKDEKPVGTSTERYGKVDVPNGLTTKKVLANIELIDAMTSGNTKLPEDVKLKIAQSPTLMMHLEAYKEQGYQLVFIPNGAASNAGMTAHIDTQNKTAMLFTADLNDDVDEFISGFAQQLLENETKAFQIADNTKEHTWNVEIDLPNIRSEMNQINLLERDNTA